MKDNEIYLRQILDSVAKIEAFTKGMSEAEFKKDVKTQSAVIMQLALIGEVSKKVGADIRARIDLPWRDIVGFRDRAIHNYFEIDLDIVWRTLSEDIPYLKENITKAL